MHPFTSQAYKETTYNNKNINSENSANINLETLINEINAMGLKNQTAKELELSNKIGFATTINIPSDNSNRNLIDVVGLNCSNNFVFEGTGRKRG